MQRCANLTVVGIIGLSVALSFSNASAEARHSAVYCLKNRDGLKIFAERVQPDGNMAFGISIWSKDENNIGVFGVALHRGDRWEYTDNMNAQSAEDRCRITIKTTADGAPSLSADPSANCESQGGAGTQIGDVRFPRNTYEGPVTFELKDADTFFGKAGKCAQ